MAGYPPSFQHRVLWLCLAGSAVLAAAVPVQAGDGSGTNNPDLLRGTYSSQCADSRYCDSGQRVRVPHSGTPQFTGSVGTSTGQRPGNCDVLIAQKIYTAECAQQLGQPRTQQFPDQPRPPVQVRGSASAGVSPAPVPQVTPQEVPVSAAVAAPQPARLPENMKRAPENSPYPVRRAPPAFGPLPDDAVQGDWSVTLRGSVVKDATSTSIESSVNPQGSVTFLAPGSSMTLRGSANLVQEGLGHFRVGSANTGITATSAISRDADFNAAVDLRLSQERAGTVTSGTNVSQAPLIGTGTASAGVLHDFGPLRAGITVSGLREIVGQTEYSDGTTQNNAGRSRTGFGVAGRLETRLSPILTGFADVALNREIYDAPSASLGMRQDSWTYSGQAGVSADWGNGITASGSVGYGLRRFDAAALGEAGGLLYGARVGYVTNDRLNLAAALESNISPAGNVPGASVRFGHELRLEARYQVNSWITGRASGGYNWARFSGISEMETGYDAGAGIDMLISDHLSMSADYGYDYATDTSGESEGTHTISLGITASR